MLDNDFENISMPEVLKQSTYLLAKKYPNSSNKMILSLIIACSSFMLTSKRVKYRESQKTGYPNWFTIIFAPSGCGKNQIDNDLKKLLFIDIKNWFISRANTFRELETLKIKDDVNTDGTIPSKKKQSVINDRISKIRNLVFEMNNGTAEGFFQEAKIRHIAKFGAMCVKITEFAKYFLNSKQDDKQFFDMLYNAFDAIIQSKSIKGENREEDIEDVPVNCVLMTDFSIFTNSKTKEQFILELETGFARRSVIIFATRKKYIDNENISEILEFETYYYKQIEKLRSEICKTFKNIDMNATYVMLPETLQERTKYSIELRKIVNETENELLIKEILDRELKTIKLSTIFAAFNHPDKTITVEDFRQAKSVIEYLSTDFKSLLNYKPKVKDRYDYLFNYFIENINKRFSKMQLVQKSNSLGFSQKKFREEFDDAIDFIKALANEKGYNLLSAPINNNTGMEYWMTHKNDDKNFDISMNEIIKPNPSNLSNLSNPLL